MVLLCDTVQQKPFTYIRHFCFVFLCVRSTVVVVVSFLFQRVEKSPFGVRAMGEKPQYQFIHLSKSIVYAMSMNADDPRI